MSTVSPDSVAQDQIKAFVERIERLEEERKAIARDIAEVYAEAKGNGFDRKALKDVVRIRSMDATVRMEHDALVGLYLAALGMASYRDFDDDENVSLTRARAPAHAHVEIIEEIPPHDADGVIIEDDETPDVVKTISAVQDGSGPAEVHTLGQAGSTPAPATKSEPASPLPEIAEPGDRGAVVPSAAPVVADRTKPNPICQDPEDCGVEASWNHVCGSCLRRRAQTEAARAVQ